MKRLSILTAIAILTVSTTGCGCFRQLWGGVRGTVKCVLAPCAGRTQCYETGYAGGCPDGTCVDAGTSLGTPYINNPTLNNNYVAPPPSVVPGGAVPNEGELVPIPQTTP